MNKYDFLKKLSLNELNLVEGITHNDILAEINSRKEQIDSAKFKVGNCYKHVHSGDIYLYRIDEVGISSINCTEIQIFDDYDFECYDDMNYSFEDMLEAEPISKETFTKAENLYNQCVKDLNKITTHYYHEIKALL